MKEFSKKTHTPFLQKNYHNLLSNPVDHYLRGVTASLKAYPAILLAEEQPNSIKNGIRLLKKLSDDKRIGHATAKKFWSIVGDSKVLDYYELVKNANEGAKVIFANNFDLTSILAEILNISGKSALDLLKSIGLGEIGAFALDLTIPDCWGTLIGVSLSVCLLGLDFGSCAVVGMAADAGKSVKKTYDYTKKGLEIGGVALNHNLMLQALICKMLNGIIKYKPAGMPSRICVDIVDMVLFLFSKMNGVYIGSYSLFELLMVNKLNFISTARDNKVDAYIMNLYKELQKKSEALNYVVNIKDIDEVMKIRQSFFQNRFSNLESHYVSVMNAATDDKIKTQAKNRNNSVITQPDEVSRKIADSYLTIQTIFKETLVIEERRIALSGKIPIEKINNSTSNFCSKVFDSFNEVDSLLIYYRTQSTNIRRLLDKISGDCKKLRASLAQAQKVGVKRRFINNTAEDKRLGNLRQQIDTVTRINDQQNRVRLEGMDLATESLDYKKVIHNGKAVFERRNNTFRMNQIIRHSQCQSLGSLLNSNYQNSNNSVDNFLKQVEDALGDKSNIDKYYQYGKAITSTIPRIKYKAIDYSKVSELQILSRAALTCFWRTESEFSLRFIFWHYCVCTRIDIDDISNRFIDDKVAIVHKLFSDNLYKKFKTATSNFEY
ncbi:hypothetical protein [Allofrancisella frigidaquae]|uniref:Uncharacterized protein n=1 Tax=Allofrancisella frigidaquae TaxID=1085644 RepID=A0A6M3HVK4_9GAMM|nr:hypothetical protein [Allofrancisella frigidaquae]QIV95160.1 hypothetical protein E3E15_07300 [Allofrancisella frigidaquae]